MREIQGGPLCVLERVRGQRGVMGLFVTTVPKVTLRNTFYINELFGTFCYKQLKSMNILLLSA
jgi:hypothetical protein